MALSEGFFSFLTSKMETITVTLPHLLLSHYVRWSFQFHCPSLRRPKSGIPEQQTEANFLYLALGSGGGDHFVSSCFFLDELFVKELFWMLHLQKDTFARYAAHFQKEGEGRWESRTPAPLLPQAESP